MQPINILKESKGSQVLIELKNGDSATGILHSIDSFMNVKLKQLTYIEREGPKFFKVDEVFIRGSTINGIQLREDIIDKIKLLEETNVNDNKNKTFKYKRNDSNKNRFYKENNYQVKNNKNIVTNYNKNNSMHDLSLIENKDNNNIKRIDNNIIRGSSVRGRGGKR